jgi:hypothetical protein
LYSVALDLGRLSQESIHVSDLQRLVSRSNPEAVFALDEGLDNSDLKLLLLLARKLSMDVGS